MPDNKTNTEPLICSFAMHEVDNKITLFIPTRKGRGNIDDIQVFYIPQAVIKNKTEKEKGPDYFEGVVVQFKGEDGVLEQLGEAHGPLPFQAVDAITEQGILLCFINEHGDVESHQLLKLA